MSENTITQCEGYRRHGGAFTLGPVSWHQCTEPATVMLKIEQQDEAVKDFPACHACWQEALQHTDKILVLEAKPIVPV